MFEAFQNFRARRLVRRIKKERRYTTDASEINASPTALVLIYDNMMVDRDQHGLISPFIRSYAGPSFSNEPVKAYIHEATGQAVAFETNDFCPEWVTPSEGTDPSVVIKGDAFQVPSDAIYELDKLFRNGVEYHRHRVSVQTWQNKSYYSEQFSRTHTSPLVARFQSAWIYLGVPEFWGVDGYNWHPMRFYRARNPLKPRNYYFYNPATDRRQQSQN